MNEPAKDRPHLRVARPEEHDEVSELMRDAYREYQTHFAPEVWEGYVRDIMDVRSRLGVADLIVAEMAGRLVGAVTFYPEASHSEREGWPAGWAGVRLLAVLPDARGLGIGKALMDECLRRCRQLAVPTLGLHTTEPMAVARGMYERMGFVRTPEYDFHRDRGLLVMAYRLDLNAS